MLNPSSHFDGDLLSFFVVMRQRLNLPSEWDGSLWHYRHQGRNAMHRHAELEFNLITQGSGLYVLENRKYEIRRGDLLWLFPAQEHVLVKESPDFEMWIGVFKPEAVRQIAVDAKAAVLRQTNAAGEYCRRLPQRELSRLEQLAAEIASTQPSPGLFNAGLHYVLLAAWQHFEGAAEASVRDVHPAVEKAARLIRNENNTLGLNELA